MATETGDHRKLGMIALVGSNPGNLRPVEVFSHHHGCEAINAPYVDPLVQRCRIGDAETGDKEQGFIEISGLIGEEEEVPCWQIVREDVTASIIDPSPNSGQGETTEPVVLRHPPPVGAFHELELGNPEVEAAEDEKDGQQENHGALPNGAEVFANLH